MSPAVAVITNPSKKLHVLAISFSLLIIVIGIFLCHRGATFISLHTLSGLLCCLCGVFKLRSSRLMQQPCWQIRISAQGQIYCQRMRSGISPADPDFDLVNLERSSILHHKVLFLHFKRTNDNNMINLMVLSDALSRDEFRRLSIACHWLLCRAK